MNLEKVIFGFFVLLALTLNFSFVTGEIDNIDHHNRFELFGAIVVSLIATVLKFGDRTHIGAVLLATSLVADLHLLLAALVWGIHVYGQGLAMDAGTMADIVSLSWGAVLANLASVTLMLAETVILRR